MSHRRYAFKPLISAYLASQIFLSGCTSISTSSRPDRICEIPASRIQFVKQPETLDEILSANSEIGQAMPYLHRFSEIKSNIRAENSVETGKGIRQLVNDVERSSLLSKDNLAKEFKDFGYYRYDKITTSTSYPGWKYMSWAISLGGLAYIFDEYDSSGEGEDELDVMAVIGVTGICLGAVWLAKNLNSKDSTSFRKVYFNPYYGTTREIENVSSPRE